MGWGFGMVEGECFRRKAEFFATRLMLDIKKISNGLEEFILYGEGA